MIEIAISKVKENEYKYLEVNSFDFIDKDGRQYKLTSADFFSWQFPFFSNRYEANIEGISKGRAENSKQKDFLHV